MSQKLNINEIIRGLDLLFSQEKFAEAGEYLRKWRQTAIDVGDEAAELSLLDEMMGYYRRAEDEERGLPAIRDGFALTEKLKLSETVSGGTIYLNGATALRSFGYVDEALLYYEKALHCYRALPPNDLRVAGLYNNMSSSYAEKKEYEKAEDCLLHALTILEQHRMGPDVAVIYVNLAQLYAEWDVFDPRVQESLDKAAEVFDSSALVRDAYYAETCRKCASAFGYFGMFAYEKELHERADTIYEGNSTGGTVLP